MKKTFLLALAALALAGAVSCGKGKDKAPVYPENFNNIGDAGRVAWMIRNATPDSVARFIIYGSLGRVDGARIDTLAIATNAAYEKLKGDDLDKFGAEYESIMAGLSLADKMRVYAAAGTEDPQGLGYRLGLEYLATVRDGSKSVKDVKQEIDAFRDACGKDTSTYRRFLIGFKTVLRVDSGKDVNREIYNTFINYQ